MVGEVWLKKGDMARKDLSRYLPVLAGTLAVALAYGGWRAALARGASLSEQGYGGGWILPEALQDPWSWLFLTLSLAVPLWRWRALRWSALGGGVLRLYAAALGLLLVWLSSLYGYNYYYDQAHLADRALLWLLWGLLLWHPAGLGPLVWWAQLMQGQFQYPLGAYSLTDLRPIYEQLMLLQIFLAAQVTLAWMRPRWPVLSRWLPVLPPFWALALCLQAANYLGPGWGKLRLGWLWEDQLANFWLAAYSYGWLTSLGTERALALAAWLTRFNQPLLLLTLILELGVVFILWRRRLTLLLLLGMVGLHLAIVALSGIFFWKWILLDLLLFGVVWRQKPAEQAALYDRPVVLAAFLLMLGSNLYFRPTSLYWYDTPLTQRFNVEVVTTTGDVYSLERNFLRPYQIIFAKEGFHVLNPEPFLVGTYGATSELAVQRALQAAERPEDLAAIGAQYGLRAANPVGQRQVDGFLRAYFQSYNQQRRFAGWLGPDHIQVERPAGAYDGQAPVARVQIRYLQSWYDGQQLWTVGDEIIHVTEIDGAD